MAKYLKLIRRINKVLIGRGVLERRSLVVKRQWSSDYAFTSLGPTLLLYILRSSVRSISVHFTGSVAIC